jgi:hypothetical protein
MQMQDARSKMQGEFAIRGKKAVRQYYGVGLDGFSTELGRRGRMLITLLADHASKRMDGSTGVGRVASWTLDLEPADH